MTSQTIPGLQDAVEVPIGQVTDTGLTVTIDLTGAATPAGNTAYDTVVLRTDTSTVPVPIGSLPEVITLLTAAGEHARTTGAVP